MIADFESVLAPCTPDEVPVGESYNTQLHQPDGYSWTCVDFNNTKRASNCYRTRDPNENVAIRLIEEIVNQVEVLEFEWGQFQEESNNNMVISEEDEMDISGECCICKKNLHTRVHDNMEGIVRHHTHLPPFNFIGYAHNYCNFVTKTMFIYPVLMHNNANYDMHFVIKALPELKRRGIVTSVEIVPKSTEKYLAVILNGKIRLLDSLAFTQSSLAELVKNLRKSNYDFSITRQEFAEEIENGLSVDLILKKGVYCYERMRSLADFELTELPPQSDFYSTLTKQGISNKKYRHAQNVWNSLNMQTMGDYHDFYVRGDSAILADVMGKIRDMIYSVYEIDILHCFSLPMVSIDCMLKYTGVEIELLTDPDKELFFSKGIRGGFCSTGLSLLFFSHLASISPKPIFFSQEA
jgi:hypothetical protein